MPSDDESGESSGKAPITPISRLINDVKASLNIRSRRASSQPESSACLTVPHLLPRSSSLSRSSELPPHSRPTNSIFIDSPSSSSPSSSSSSCSSFTSSHSSVSSTPSHENSSESDTPPIYQADNPISPSFHRRRRIVN